MPEPTIATSHSTFELSAVASIAGAVSIQYDLLRSSPTFIPVSSFSPQTTAVKGGSEAMPPRAADHQGFRKGRWMGLAEIRRSPACILTRAFNMDHFFSLPKGA